MSSTRASSVDLLSLGALARLAVAELVLHEHCLFLIILEFNRLEQIDAVAAHTIAAHLVEQILAPVANEVLPSTEENKDPQHHQRQLDAGKTIEFRRVKLDQCAGSDQYAQHHPRPAGDNARRPSPQRRPKHGAEIGPPSNG